MIDQAGIMMAQGASMACERIQGMNDNMEKSHYHEYYELYYLEQGERYHMIQDHLCKVYPGEFLIFPPYVMHHSYGEENVPFKRFLLYFRKDQLSSPELAEAMDSTWGVYKPDVRSRQTIRRMLEDLIKEQNSPGAYSRAYSHTLLNMLLLHIFRQIQAPVRPEKRDRIGEVISYIHANYQEDMNLDQLAQMFYVSTYYLCREFKKYTNSTIVQYINSTRIMNAQRKMMETDMNITEISKAVGFSSITHFNRVFKAVAGMTPSMYRKAYKEKIPGNTNSRESVLAPRL